MKIINNILRVFSFITIGIALTLQIIFQKSEGQYMGSTISVFMSSIAILFVTYIPEVFEKRNIKVKKTFYIIILISILLAMAGGFIFRFYIIFAYYDTLVHFINGGILVIIVFVIAEYVSVDSKKHIIPIILLSILAAISLGTIWEIYEFAIDSLFAGSNMQRFQDVKTGIDFVGQAALNDTMVDLIVDTLGALLVGTFLYFDHLNDNKFINKITLELIEENN